MKEIFVNSINNGRLERKKKTMVISADKQKKITNEMTSTLLWREKHLILEFAWNEQRTKIDAAFVKI